MRSYLFASILLASACATDPATTDPTLCDDGKCDSGDVSPDLIAAAKANLQRVTKEADMTHLHTYGYTGAVEDQFIHALSSEHQHQHPDQYAARVRALASMVFFSLPDVEPPAGFKKTPFHGLNDDQFNALMSIEDSVFQEL